MEYKTYKAVDELVEYLRTHKKIIIPTEYKHVFIEQNYISVINSYKEFFAFGVSGPKKQHVYKKKISIEKILEIYEFDNWLSKYFYDLIGCFEKRFKNILIQEICSLYNENCGEDKLDKYCISYVEDIYNFVVEYEKIKDTDKEKLLNLQNIPRFCNNIFYSLDKEKYNFNINILDSRISLLKKIYVLGGGKRLRFRRRYRSEKYFDSALY